MAKTVKETTKAPTGITITRNNEVLTVTWKIAGRDYGKGQYFQQLINTGKNSSWTPAKNTNIGIRAYSKAVTVKKTSFYPYKGKPILKSVGVRIKGHQKDYTTGSGKKKRKHVMSASGWATKYYTFNPPLRPSISKALNEELTNVCKFSWNVTVANNTTQMFTDVQLQSIFVKNSTESDGSKLNWSKALTEIKGSTGDRTFTEDTAILYKNGDTYTRWVRVRSRGPAGNSAWSYACQVYALPNQANVLNTYAEETEEGGFRCIVDWEVTGNQKNPIDRTMVQYTILTPDEDLTCPSGASWTDANISRDTSYGDAAVFSIDDQLGKDQCLFIRVNTQHDGNITYGKPQLSSVGYLRDPSGLSVRTDPTTYRATVQATNISEIPDSFLVVRYVPAEGDPIPIGVIPHGEASVTVQCPDWSDQPAIAFDVYAAVGSYEKQPREDGVDSYNIVVRMQSQKTISQGGQVPVAPQQVSVHRVEGKPDTVRVSWDWPWSEAGSAEIAWSDHDDAWESTDEPETYMVSNLHASHWNISGLETGRTWYIRVRLIKGSIDNSEDVTYGPWSDINQGTIDLSSAPNKPTLILSDPVIPGDGVTTASWVYTTTDNTYQAYGEVAIVAGEEYTPIAHALTEQHVTIDATQVGLEVGNVYNLSCRVRSASGRVSEWSDTVSVAIAEPLVCEITETSLEPDVVEVNPRSFGPGANVAFNTTVEEIAAKLKVNMEPIQEGSGTPSPDNVRPISGRDSVSVVVSPTQSAEDGSTYTTDLNQTVYGGTVDLATGVLTVDRKMVDLSTIGATYNTGWNCWVKSPNIADAKVVSANTIPMDAIASNMTAVMASGYTANHNAGTFAQNTSGLLFFDNGSTTELTGQLVYELAQPQTYQLTPHQIQTLVGQNNVWSDAGEVEVRIAEAMRDTIALKEMPFSLTVTGAGEGGLTSVTIERSEDYALDRPDEDKFQGHKGEVVLQTSPPIVGEEQIVFQVEDLLGSLDDGASYLIRAIVQDGLGQRAEAVLGFEVHWRDQAVEPSAEITLDQEELIAFIKPLAVEGMLPTDVADIYRLSADKPKLIVKGATFGETYVDPFPALGDMGGHRIVTRTKNGDYITEDNQLAMVDSPELEVNPLDNEELLNIIDFDGRQILFYWDSNYSNTWTKDFQRTRYLGGSDQGDWNEGIERTGNLTSRAITVLDQEMVKDVRRLAEYSGLCHVRTADGSSYSADVQVSDDYVDDDQGMVVNYSLSITRVDEQELDGMTLDQWNAENPGEEGEE